MEKKILEVLIDMQATMVGFKGVMADFKSEMVNMKTEMSELKTEMRNGFAEVNTRLDKIDITLHGIGGQFEETNKTIIELRDDVYK